MDIQDYAGAFLEEEQREIDEKAIRDKKGIAYVVNEVILLNYEKFDKIFNEDKTFLFDSKKLMHIFYKGCLSAMNEAIEQAVRNGGGTYFLL